VKRIALGHLSLEGIPQGRYHLLEKRQADTLRTPQPAPKSLRPFTCPTKPHRHPTSPPKRKSPR
jgi:hypothetical protein